MADPTLPVIYRDIPIRQSELPGAPFEWVIEEDDAHGIARTLERAKQQIDAHLAAADTDWSEDAA